MGRFRRFLHSAAFILIGVYVLSATIGWAAIGVLIAVWWPA